MTADQRLKDARECMAYLQRYADRLDACDEGHVYLNLLTLYSAKALQWAQNHPVGHVPSLFDHVGQ